MTRTLRVALLVLVALVLSAPIAPRAVNAPTEKEPLPASRATQLPLRFEANAGQWDDRVRFATRQGGVNLFVTDDGMTFALHGPERDAAVHMRIAGAKPRTPRGEERLVTKSHFFLGNDASKWRTNVPNYGQVRTTGGVQGVDVVWHGKRAGLEYDLEVAPGVDAQGLELVIEGGSLQLAGDEGLEVVTAAGTLLQRPPLVFQAGRVLSTRYVLSSPGRVRFAIEGYDPRLAVLIDPAIAFSTTLGGTVLEEARGIAVGANGEAYLAGATSSMNFPTKDPLQPAHGTGTYDAFVSKLNAAGSALVYATYLGGSSTDEASAISVDAGGNAYVTGRTYSTNFPTQNALKPTPVAGSEVFVAKLNAMGSALVYSTYLGGSADDRGLKIHVDANGNAFVMGNTLSNDFPTQGPMQLYAGSYDTFVSKLNAAGSALVYSTYLGSSDYEQPQDMAIDANGNVYVTGYASGTSFPTQGAIQPLPGGGTYDAFVSKLNATGSALVYSTYLGGSGSDEAYGIAVDANGNAYVVGYTDSTDFPTQAPLQAAKGTLTDLFVTKLNAAGSALSYSTYLGGNSTDYGVAIAVDASGNATVTGRSHSTNFPTQQPIQPAFAGGSDVVVSTLNALGSGLLFSTYLGGSTSDECQAIALDASGSIYVSGWTGSSDFPRKTPPQAAFGGGARDAFVFKIAREVGAVCTTAAQCASQFCVNGYCCNEACSGGCDRCDVANKEGTCTVSAKGTGGADPTCTLPYACDGASGTCPSSCTSDDQCASAYYCGPAGTCLPQKAQAATCNLQMDCKTPGCRECTSGHCVDGFCCNGPCTGLCQACASALKQGGGLDGTCGNAKDGLNPHGDACTLEDPTTCQHDGKCDGLGACRPFYKAGTSCGPSECSSTKAVGKLCDGKGQCASSPSGIECAPFSCKNGGCTATCKTTADCASDGWCNAGICEKRKGIGDGCSIGESCSSGFCSDGLCCNSACDGQCEACDDERGTCKTVTGKPHGARSACPPGLVCAPGATGCVPPPGEATCDGDHTTTGADGVPLDCAPYKCKDDGSCLIACTSVADCVAPTVCDPSGKCVPPPAPASDGGCSIATKHASGSMHTAWIALCLAALTSRRRRPLQRR